MEENFVWLKKSILTMGSKTVQAVDMSINAMLLNDASLAAKVRYIEKRVDCMYYAINEHCLDTLSDVPYTRQQVNFIANSLKIAMELERMCDYANQIAKLVQKKFSQQDVKQLKSCQEDVAGMKEKTLFMLKTALTAYEQLDPDLSMVIKRSDASVDKSNKDLYRNMICLVSVNPWLHEAAMDYHVAIRYIERVADRATNIAELVYYIVNGEPIKKKVVQEELWNDD
jgi:phosphate transport system protein